MIAVPLGCCPDSPRCLLCPPAPAVPPELVDGLRVAAGHGGVVRFFGGAPPSDAQLEPVRDHAIEVRVRPDLLTRADAQRLMRAGVRRIELDALSFHNDPLRQVGRAYRRHFLLDQVAGLRALGLEVGGVLAPGLPGQSHDEAVEDARTAASLWSFARIHPVLVLDHSALRELHELGRYRPLALREAITVCRAMVDVLEDADVDVIRVGLQPGPDGMGRAVAGPRHSSLRELVEASRTLDRLRSHLTDVPPGSAVVVACAPADETRTRGPLNQSVRTLRAEFRLAELTVIADPMLPRGSVRVHVPQETL